MKNSYGLYMECIFLVVACISFKKGQNSQMHLGEMNIYEAKHRPGKLNDYNISMEQGIGNSHQNYCNSNSNSG